MTCTATYPNGGCSPDITTTATTTPAPAAHTTDSLAFTGAEVLLFTLIALACIIGGSIGTIVSRHRRQQDLERHDGWHAQR